MKKSKIIISTVLIVSVLLSFPLYSVGALTTYEDGNYSFAETSDSDFVSLYGFSSRITSESDVVVPDLSTNRYVNSVYEYAFYNNTLIKSLDFSNTRHLYYIDSRAFSNSSVTGEVIFPSTLKSIGFAAFQDCKNITSVTFGNRLTEIPVQCFYGCHSLETVLLSYNTEVIGNLAFADCPKLSYIFIPASVNDISPSAFDNSFNTVVYCYTDSYAHEYCVTNGIRYVLLDAPEKPTTEPAATDDTTEEPSTVESTTVVEPTEQTTADQSVTEDPTTIFTEPSENITTIPASPDEPVFSIGDVNGDGIVDVLDATYVQKFAAEQITFTPAQFARADVNKDGYADVIDSTIIQKIAVGKI